MDHPAAGSGLLEPLHQPQARLGTDLLSLEQREVVHLEIRCHSKWMSSNLAAINLATPADVTTLAFRNGNLG